MFLKLMKIAWRIEHLFSKLYDDALQALHVLPKLFKYVKVGFQ